jgi:hypothetical protein
MRATFPQEHLHEANLHDAGSAATDVIMTAIRATNPWIVRLLVGVLIASFMSVAPSTPADAASYSASGSPGGTTHYPVQGRAINVGAVTPVPGLVAPGPTVSRSSASAATQSVLHEVVVFRWQNGAWVRSVSSQVWQTLNAGQSATLPSNTFTSPPTLGGYGYYQRPGMTGWYNVEHHLTWYETSTSRFLGRRVIDYNNSTADYTCIPAAYVYCSAARAGMIYLTHTNN